ncbi:MAG: hypothetical protein J4F37_06110 [Acidobacteria bacterium]|nr:hypothetical protein [Acidobacteriota bacterium]
MSQAMAGRPPRRQEMSIAQWLFNPFVRFAGAPALGIGLTIIVATGLVAAAAGVHLDGLLDFHPGYTVPLWVPVVEGLVNWSVFTVLVWAVSLLITGRTVRLVDIAGTQALSRHPILLSALVCAPPGVRRAHEETVAAMAEGRLALPQGWEPVVAALVIAACLFWMVWLMWKAFSLCCNQRGARAVTIFAALILVGEVATKYALGRVLQGLAATGLAVGIPG